MKEYFKKIFIVFITFFLSFYIDASIVENPLYKEYINLTDKSNVGLVPSETLNEYDIISRNYFNSNLSPRTFSSSLPSFDLRNDSGKRNIPTIDNQKNLSLCWAFSTNNTLESYLLKKGYSEYNFSENQMDYVSRYLGDTKNFGEGNSVVNVLNYWYYGYSPVTENYFGDYFTSYKEKRMSEYIDSANTVLDIRDALWLPSFDIKNSLKKYDISTVKTMLSTYSKDIKNHLVNYGAIATGIFSDFYNKDTNLLYNDGSKNYTDYAASSHAVTIIGWDDNYGSITYNGNVLKGSWLAMNSWGDYIDYFYISYYDVDVYNYLIGVKNVNFKTYNYNYTEYLNKTTNNKTETYTYFIGNEREKVEGIKVLYKGSNKSKLTIKISDGTTTKTSPRTEDLHYGVNYFDIDDFNTNTNGNLYVYVTNNDNITYNLSILTSNTNKEEKYYTKTKDTFNNKVGNVTKYNLISKNILSGTNYEVKVIDSNNKDISSNFSIIKNVNLINNYSNFTLKLNKVLSNTNFHIEINSNGFVDYEYDESSLEGSGTLDNPYLIKKLEDLKYLSNSYDYFKLMNDIDLKYSTTSNNGYYYNSGKGFVPLDFNGKLDGNNHTISNLNSYVGGLFNKLKDAKVTNLKLYNFNIDIIDSETLYSGVLASLISNSTLNNIEIDSSYIKGYNSVGTLSGQAENDININNILINGDVNGNDNTGGLLGNLIVNSNKNISIKNTFINDSNINGTYDIYTGSLIGLLFISSSNATLNISNNNTYSNIKNIIGTTFNYSNLSYINSNNNILSNIYDYNSFNLYDKNIWTFSSSNSLYLISFPKSDIIIPDINIIVNKYDFNNNIIFISSDNNKVSDIINNITIDSKLSYEFYDSKNKKLSSSNYIGTNGYLKVSNNITSKDYHFVIYGDINGDGKVNIVDTMMCANYILDTSYNSNDLQHRAANVDNNKRIDIVDVIKISNYILSPEDGF